MGSVGSTVLPIPTPKVALDPCMEQVRHAVATAGATLPVMWGKTCKELQRSKHGRVIGNELVKEKGMAH